MFKPSAQQFATVIRLQHRQQTVVNGAPRSSYQDADPALHMCEFKPFYGAEAIQAGQLGITQGGTITMWYTPEVKTSDRILLNDDTALAFDVMTPPENVENRNMFLVFKVKRVVTS